jgi:hypothetical protein
MKRLLAIVLIVVMLGLLGCEVDEDMDIQSGGSAPTASVSVR